jgi:hypothetical protein
MDFMKAFMDQHMIAMMGEIVLFKVWVLPNKSIYVKEKKLVFHPKRDRIYERKGDRIVLSYFSSSIQNVKGVDFILK